MEKNFLTRKELAAYLGISTSSLDRARKSGDLPQAIKLSVRRIGWRKSDVDAYLASKSARERE